MNMEKYIKKKNYMMEKDVEFKVNFIIVYFGNVYFKEETFRFKEVWDIIKGWYI